MKKFLIKVNGSSYEVEVEEIGGLSIPSSAAVSTQAASSPVVSPVSTAVSSGNVAVKTAPSSSTGTPVTAPMPGTIVKLNAENGKTVKKGETVLILEALKMENEIVAPIDGKVIALNVSKGASVNAGEVLFNIG